MFVAPDLDAALAAHRNRGAARRRRDLPVWPDPDHRWIRPVIDRGYRRPLVGKFIEERLGQPWSWKTDPATAA